MTLDGVQIIETQRRTRQRLAQGQPPGDAKACQYCGHPMSDHHLFEGSYEDPEPEVDCCGRVHPLVGCICEGPPSRWTDEQHAAMDPEMTVSPPSAGS